MTSVPPTSQLASSRIVDGGALVAADARLLLQESGNAGVVCSSCTAVFGLVPELNVEPSEGGLRVQRNQLFKSLRRGIRSVLRFLRWSVDRWADWLVRLLCFLGVALVAPLLDRSLVTTWRQKGWRDALRAILLGSAVFVRLLLDHKAPLLGKLLVALGLLYGVASSDLMPDASLPLGVLDDIVAVGLASRVFMRLCPDSLIEAHALRASRALERRRN